MEFLGDDGAQDYRRSAGSSTHGATSVAKEHRASLWSDVTVAAATASPGSTAQSKEEGGKSHHASRRPLEDTKLQSLVDFSKKVGLNHRVIQTVHLIEQSGQINTPGFMREKHAQRTGLPLPSRGQS